MATGLWITHRAFRHIWEIVIDKMSFLMGFITKLPNSEFAQERELTSSHHFRVAINSHIVDKELE